MRRIAQLLWIPAYLADIESDMSAVHRIDDIWSMPSARFFRLAHRLPAYQGVMRERVLALAREQEETPRPASQPAGQPQRFPAPAAAPVTEAALSDPVMSKIFSFG
jgi:hypothetical protein